jgi:hypothetical protein
VVIRIDVHTVRENSTNTQHAFHAQSTYGLRPYVSHAVHIKQPFKQSSTNLNISTTSEKKGSQHNPQHADRPIYGSVPSFSQTIANGAVGKSQASVDNWLLDLPGPYHRHVIGIQYLLAEANRTVLNRYRRGLQTWRCRLATYPLPDHPSQLFPLSPSGPARSPETLT